MANCKEPIISPHRHDYEDWLGSAGSNTANDCYCLTDKKIGSHFKPSEASNTLKKLYSSIGFLELKSPITQVLYGLKKNKIDITQNFLNTLEQENYVVVSNELAGSDPCYGVVKRLSISLQNGNRFEFNEGMSILIGGKHK